MVLCGSPHDLRQLLLCARSLRPRVLALQPYLRHVPHDHPGRVHLLIRRRHHGGARSPCPSTQEARQEGLYCGDSGVFSPMALVLRPGMVLLSLSLSLSFCLAPISTRSHPSASLRAGTMPKPVRYFHQPGTFLLRLMFGLGFRVSLGALHSPMLASLSSCFFPRWSAAVHILSSLCN